MVCVARSSRAPALSFWAALAVALLAILAGTQCIAGDRFPGDLLGRDALAMLPQSAETGPAGTGPAEKPTASPAGQGSGKTGGQPSGKTNESESDAVQQVPAEVGKRGYLTEITLPLTSQSVDELIAALKVAAAATSGAAGRKPVVLHFQKQRSTGETTPFEVALKLSRALTGADTRTLRTIVWLDGQVKGHAVLPILTTDTLLVGPGAVLEGFLSEAERGDEIIQVNYSGLAAKRGLFPAQVVECLLEPDRELVRVTTIGGTTVFASGESLVKLRETGQAVNENQWSSAGQPLVMSANQLVEARIAAAMVQSQNELAEFLDLAKLVPLQGGAASETAQGVLCEITGSIASNRADRWQSNLNASLAEPTTNAWMIRIDSDGGSFDSSVGLAESFSQLNPPILRVAGYLENEARADAALVALSCKPLLMNPQAILGGQGASTIEPEQIEMQKERLESIARQTGRSLGLVKALLCPSLEVFSFTNKKTGQIVYSTESELFDPAADPELERQRWTKGQRVDLSQGVDLPTALDLGLVDGESDSLEQASINAGFEATPPLVSERKLIRFVERLGRSRSLMTLLLVMGFMALSAEFNAPGIGVPGFMALVCFGLFFWMNMLAGTAEWLELVLLMLGLGCLAMELFVLPGFGIFGIGGLLMVIAAIVLMTQTFILPSNNYQLGVATRGVWGSLIGLVGLIGGFLLMQKLFPHVPMFRHLVMEAPDLAAMDEAEKLVDYSSLLYQQGVATTALRPSGKAMFGDQLVQVVSDGGMVEKGTQVKVVEVHGAKVVVEA